MPRHLQPIRLLLVDDSVLVREGIRAVLAAHEPPGGIEVVGESAGVADAIADAVRLQPDVVLLDIRLPDGSGFTACREILKLCPHSRVVILTSFSSDSYIHDAITSGAQGYLMKEIAAASLIEAIQDVAAGKSILSPDITAGVMRMMRAGEPQGKNGDLASLSPQERRVLALVAAGKTNKEIGKDLTLSGNTVKNYLGSIFEKLQVRRRAQAAALFVENKPTGGSEVH